MDRFPMRSLPLIRFASYAVVAVILIGFYPHRYFIDYEIPTWGEFLLEPLSPLEPIDREVARENFEKKSGITHGGRASSLAYSEAIKFGADVSALRAGAEYFQQFGDSGWYVVTFTVAWQHEGKSIVGFFVDETRSCIPIYK